MNDIKAKAIEKLMMVLDEVLGEDVAGRLKDKMHESTEEKEEGEEEGEEKKMASGGASILALPEAESEEMPMEKKGPKKPEGLGIEVKDVKVAAMPKPGLMKKMRGLS